MKNAAIALLVFVTLITGFYAAKATLVSLPRDAESSRAHQININERLNIGEFVYNECTYIYLALEESALITHKGSCQNPIHDPPQPFDRGSPPFSEPKPESQQ